MPKPGGRRKPEFRRPESWRYGRLKESWRRPRGTSNKVRLGMRGWPRRVKVGYRSPRSVRGLHPSGLQDVLIHNLGELEALDPKTQGARLASSLGRRKREVVLARARELGIRVFNP
jgi:large subunit ribosomal protein L32e